MFLNSLFLPIETVLTPTGVSVRGRLDTAHAVFAAHFPQQPVLPGVVMMALAEEIARTTGCLPDTARLSMVKNAKFLAPILPTEDSELTFSLTLSPLDQPPVSLKAVIENKTTRCAVLSLLF